MEDEFFTLPQSAEGSPDPTKAMTAADMEAIPESLVLHLVIIAGHTLCDIKKVDYHVWVKEDRAEKISLNANKKTIGVNLSSMSNQ